MAIEYSVAEKTWHCHFLSAGFANTDSRSLTCRSFSWHCLSIISALSLSWSAVCWSRSFSCSIEFTRCSSSCLRSANIFICPTKPGRKPQVTSVAGHFASVLSGNASQHYSHQKQMKRQNFFWPKTMNHNELRALVRFGKKLQTWFRGLGRTLPQFLVCRVTRGVKQHLQSQECRVDKYYFCLKHSEECFIKPQNTWWTSLLCVFILTLFKETCK